jgi:hypothetical protein
VNEPLSHGFLRFSIAPFDSIPLETDVHNEAAIYFDFNEPIFTNLTVHRFGENFMVSNVKNQYLSQFKLQVAPNPMGEQVFFSLKDYHSAGSFHWTVTDMSGRIILQRATDSANLLIQANMIQPGSYTVLVGREGMPLATATFVVR